MSEQHTPPIHFHTRPWTLGDQVMARRIARDMEDVEALVALIVSRSDASEATILALPVAELEPIIAQLDASIKTMGLLGVLSRAWQTPADED